MWALALLALFLAGLSWELAWYDTHAKWDTRDAQIALRKIAMLRRLGLQSTPEVSAHYLQQISECHVPKKWKRPDLHLGELVESQRAAAIREVAERLEKITAKHLGNDPDAWVEATRGMDSDSASRTNR